MYLCTINGQNCFFFFFGMKLVLRHHQYWSPFRMTYFCLVRQECQLVVKVFTFTHDLLRCMPMGLWRFQYATFSTRHVVNNVIDNSIRGLWIFGFCIIFQNCLPLNNPKYEDCYYFIQWLFSPILYPLEMGIRVRAELLNNTWVHNYNYN